ncbi:helix-turn-helix domain-containing protein, partial [Enterococcus faecium]
AREGGYTLDLVDGDILQISVDETVTDDELRELTQLLGGNTDEIRGPADGAWPEDLRRTSSFMTHPVFSSYHTETTMMRYLKRLADRDYGLDRGMIPLGSCTMKLNAAAEMEAMTWPAFSQMHPFAPVEDQAGSLRLIRDLEIWLAELTGYDTVSLQPNAGSQGEYTGLAAIRSYHVSRGDTERNVCLVPASAHGTNAASAASAGLRVVVVKSHDDGTIDRDDLAAKIAANEGRIAAIMITYPSTHGVYEDGVRQVCDMVHEAGGQVYIDGANFNALVGWGQFARIGGDVSHLNLHKTFAIPHGGGGPGVGPVAAKAHLAPFLPGHPLNPRNEHPLNDGGTVTHDGHAVSAAPFGSVSVLPISWAYLRLMGLKGLQFATEVAVLNANYIAHRLHDKIPILYTGQNGYVAHECILDLRPLTAETGITVDDVADHVGYSPAHFSRAFAQVTALSPGQYLAAVRFDAAKRLLLAEDFAVSEVCAAVGFDSLPTFTRRFSRAVGTTPAALRRLAESVGEQPPRPFEQTRGGHAPVRVRIRYPDDGWGGADTWLG